MQVLKRGSRGDAVTRLSRTLVKHGLLDAETSVFDSKVDRAVRVFQASQVDERDRPLKIDGLVGPVTAWRLAHLNQAPKFAPDSIELPKTPPVGGSPRGRAALRAALAEIEASARESGGNNRGPFVDKYRNGLGSPGDPWCAAFVSFCYAQHAQGEPFKYSLGARNIWNQFRSRGWALALSATVQPEPGDIVAWRRFVPGNPHAGHIGLVYSMSPGGILYTIEGNKGPTPAPVRRFSYVFSQMEKLLGFGRVPAAV